MARGEVAVNAVLQNERPRFDVVRGAGGYYFAIDREGIKVSFAYADAADALALRDWLVERAAGYPARILPWPKE